MKKLNLMPVILLLALALVWGCGSDDDDGGTGPGPQPTFGSITGVVDGATKALSGAQVTVGALSATTNQDGYFSITNVPVGEQVVHFSYAGNLSVHRVVDIQDGVNTHIADVFLTPVETRTVDGATGGTAATGDGDGSVEFGANAFENMDGTAYTGDVNIDLVAMLPDDGAFYETFPGDFEGVREDGSTTQFISFGFMDVNLYNADKSAPIRLADGQTASLSLTVDSEFAKSAPATIPMWWFDEENGVWREEGEATLNGNVYEADVEHFTTWNWDLPIDDVCTIEGVVVDTEGEPVANARVISAGVENALMDDAWTNANGEFSVRAVKNTNTDVWAQKGSLVSEPVRVWVGEDCPVVLTVDLVLTVPAFSISLTWGLTPSDLDSHLWIPAPWLVPEKQDPYYHLYYGTDGTLAEPPYAELDTDDTSSYGPEIITGTRLYEGVYEYWVRHFSADDAQVLLDSEAVVQLEIGGELRLYEAADLDIANAPANSYWHVFDFTVGANGSVTVQNVMEFQDMWVDGPAPNTKVADTK